MSQFMSLGCKFMEFVKRSFNWWKPVKYIVHHFPTREHASYYVSYLAQSWQPLCYKRFMMWMFNKYVSRADWTKRETIRGRLLKPRQRKKKTRQKFQEKKKETQNRLNIQYRMLLGWQSHAAKNKQRIFKKKSFVAPTFC